MISSRDFLRGKSAVIFDFDGTLGDTIDLWNRIDVVLAEELGYPGLDPRECHAFREAELRRHKNEEKRIAVIAENWERKSAASFQPKKSTRDATRFRVACCARMFDCGKGRQRR